MSVEPRSPSTVEKRTKTGVCLPASANSDARVYSGMAFVHSKIAVRRRAARVHDALGNALVVEVRDLLAKDEVLEQRRPAQASLERVLVVGDRHALIGRQRAVGRIDAHAIERADRRVLADVRPAAADFRPIRSTSLTVLAPTIGSRGLTDAPSGGASAASGSYSAALVGLKGNAEATSCAATAFSAAISPFAEASGSAGPLTVVRLLRVMLLCLELFAGRERFWAFEGRDDFAMCIH